MTTRESRVKFDARNKLGISSVECIVFPETFGEPHEVDMHALLCPRTYQKFMLWPEQTGQWRKTVRDSSEAERG